MEHSWLNLAVIISVIAHLYRSSKVTKFPRGVSMVEPFTRGINVEVTMMTLQSFAPPWVTPVSKYSV